MLIGVGQACCHQRTWGSLPASPIHAVIASHSCSSPQSDANEMAAQTPALHGQKPEVIRPILSPSLSVNQRAPSGPLVIPRGLLPAVGIGYSLMLPPVVMR